MKVKVFQLPPKFGKYNLPTNIIKHCNIYKEETLRNSSKFAWFQLSKYIDLSKVKFTKNGKPIHPKQYFSLSHSMNMVAIAISDKPVGIDIETLLPKNISTMLAARLLKGKELKQYYAAKDREIWFTKYWTQHEAYIKLIGDKLTIDTFKEPIKAKIKSKKIKATDKRIYLLSIAEK